MNEEQVIACINRAFETVPEPSKDLITNCTCEECLEIRDDLAGKQPEEIPEDRMSYHCWDMGFLTPLARHYYLAGWMRLGLTQPDLGYSDAVIEILRRNEGWDAPGGYTEGQKRSILEFLTLTKLRKANSSDRDLEIAWDRWSMDSESDSSR